MPEEGGPVVGADDVLARHALARFDDARVRHGEDAGNPPPAVPSADDAVAHTLLNCLVREISGPEGQTSLADGRLTLRLPRRGTTLGVALRRASPTGAHRFTGPVAERRDGGWTPLSWQRLAEHVHAELTLRSGVANDEFLAQLTAGHRAVRTALAAPRRVHGSGALAAYLASEQSLLLGHRFHPTPKAHGGEPSRWAAYAPEAGAAFGLRLLAVRAGLTAEECAEPGAASPLDRLGDAPPGYRLLPAHPWQYDLLRERPALRAALARGDVLDLGTGSVPFVPTASVRTLYDGETFLKFSLDVRITNCVRKNAHYELSGAVALTRLLRPVFEALAARFPGTAVLREPAYRSLALPGPGSAPDRELLEGLGVIVRDGLGRHQREGTTALLAAAVADEYPNGPGRVGHLLAGRGPGAALDWWRRYLELLVPPVLAAYFDHGLVLEPHLQNVVVCVDPDGLPVQILLRDLEGAKLLPGPHARALAALPPQVAGPLTYDPARGWHRVVYCLLVNHAAELLAALADRHPHLEHALWQEVRGVLARYADEHGPARPELTALLAGAPLPAKANLLTRWRRDADRDAGYVLIDSPLAPPRTTPGARTGTETR
ncbi:IucA/IucC family protein [Streptomyces sp. t39]|uniref:IucA/IucC family protein n=1 Tax=Streptomyces sp. t39 TaxID=1828156 RepID=UPI0011CD6B83|nr:IucA/IucC family protein [Streptomyces sp. t39]TXS44417.1 iron transporter [Streptomyces sp. t39]